MRTETIRFSRSNHSFFWLGVSTVMWMGTTWPAPASAGQPDPAHETLQLESTSGGYKGLDIARGKVAVIFYEDRAHTADNDELKAVLGRYAMAGKARGEVVLIPIANVGEYDFRPARDIARAAIRAVARKINVEILIDWRKQLQRPPFLLSPNASNVAVLDRRGRLVFRHAGALAGQDRTEFFRVVRNAIRERSTPPLTANNDDPR